RGFSIGTAVLGGGLFSLIPFCLARFYPSRPVARHAIAVAQMLMSILLITLTGGRMETHLLSYVSLLLLHFYRDWRIFVSSGVVMTANYLLLGVLSFYFPASDSLSANR